MTAHSRRTAVSLSTLFIVCIVGWLASWRLASAAERRSISDFDLFKFVWIADPQISPDGSQVVFVRVTVNQKGDGYETSLWMVPTSAQLPPRRFTRGTRDAAPRWSPDGKQLAFLRSVEKDGKPQAAQIYLMALGGGEAQAVTDLPKGVGPPSWSPTGNIIAFTSTTTLQDLAERDRKGESEKQESKKQEGKEKETDPEPARKTDVRVITRAVYRANGDGYPDPTRPSHIWTIELPAASGGLARPKSITSGEFDEENIQWSPDGSRVYFTSTRTSEPYYLPNDSDLYYVASGGGEITEVASIDGPIGSYSPSRDGKRIAFVGYRNGRPLRSYDQPDLFVADVAAGAASKNLTASYDFDIDAGLTADQHAPRGNQPSDPAWTSDGHAVFVVTAERGRANLKRIDSDSGKVDPLTNGDQEVIAYTTTFDGSQMVVLVSTPTNIGDLFLVSSAGGPMKRLTSVNDELFSQITVTQPEEIWYTSFDGKKVQAWIQKPPDFDATRKYPLILNIHGGPHAAYGYTFFHEFQWMAAKGFVVLFPNPRGSTSYGQDFGNIIQYRYPGDDYKDLMAGVDEVIKRGYIDPSRLGVTGGSGGGLLTNWVITQTDRFAAAASQRSIADWGGFWYTADFTLFTPTWFHAPPWQDRADFAARSPITYIQRVKTPLMLIEGETDYRTPPADGGEQMFRALKFRKIPTVMVRFPDETHELSRSGKPWHRVERLQHIVGWFEKYLQGKKLETYDVQG